MHLTMHEISARVLRAAVEKDFINATTRSQSSASRPWEEFTRRISELTRHLKQPTWNKLYLMQQLNVHDLLAWYFSRKHEWIQWILQLECECWSFVEWFSGFQGLGLCTLFVKSCFLPWNMTAWPGMYADNVCGLLSKKLYKKPIQCYSVYSIAHRTIYDTISTLSRIVMEAKSLSFHYIPCCPIKFVFKVNCASQLPFRTVELLISVVDWRHHFL